jgi:4-hydroxybenzoate polyprenyltransferase
MRHTEGIAITAGSGHAAAIFDLSRGRQALLSVAQPALGAVLALGALPAARTIVLGLIAATAGYLAVFSLNDVLDRRVDSEAIITGQAESPGFDLDTAFMRHPLARGDLSLAASVAWVGVLAAISAVCAFLLAPVCLLYFALAVALEVAYCGLRSVTWTKTFISGVMVAVGGLAGWAAVAPVTSSALPFFAFLALWEIAGRNLPNDLSDLGPDSAVGIRTVATVFGPRVSANATLVGAVLTIGVLAAIAAPWPVRLAQVAAGIALMGVPAVLLARRPTGEQAGSYFNVASLLPAVVFAVAVLGLIAGA